MCMCVCVPAYVGKIVWRTIYICVCTYVYVHVIQYLCGHVLQTCFAQTVKMHEKGLLCACISIPLCARVHFHIYCMAYTCVCTGMCEAAQAGTFYQSIWYYLDRTLVNINNNKNSIVMTSLWKGQTVKIWSQRLCMWERIMFITHLKPLQPNTAITDDLYVYEQTCMCQTHLTTELIISYLYAFMWMYSQHMCVLPVTFCLCMYKEYVERERERERIIFITHLKPLQPKTAIWWLGLVNWYTRSVLLIYLKNMYT